MQVEQLEQLLAYCPVQCGTPRTNPPWSRQCRPFTRLSKHRLKAEPKAGESSEPVSFLAHAAQYVRHGHVKQAKVAGLLMACTPNDPRVTRLSHVTMWKEQTNEGERSPSQGKLARLSLVVDTWVRLARASVLRI